VPLDCHRRRSEPKDAGLPAFEGPRPGVERIGFHEQAAALPKQIFALRGEAKTPADAVEEPYTELRSRARESAATPPAGSRPAAPPRLPMLPASAMLTKA